MTYSAKIPDFLVQFAGAAGVGGVFPTGWASWTPPTFPGASVFLWDTTNLKLYIYDWTAAAWKAAGGGSGGFDPFAISAHPVAPLASAFTLVQSTALAGTATKADLASGRGVAFTIPDHNAAGHNIAILMPTTKPTGFATALTFSTLLHINRQACGTGGSGIYIRDTANQIITWMFYPGAADARANSLLCRQAYASVNTPTGTITSWNLNTPEVPFWMKFNLASSAITISFSYDGENFGQLDTTTMAGISTFFNGTIQDYGVFGDLYDNGAGGPFQASLFTNIYEFNHSSP